MLDPKELCKKLAKYYWSPVHPSQYVTPEGRGLGVLAHGCYGSFNLIWATHQLKTRQDHIDAISAFSVQKAHMTQFVKGAEMSTWLTLLTPHELSFWYKDNGVYVNKLTRINIEKALYALQHVQRI
jgi:hypothetical protein